MKKLCLISASIGLCLVMTNSHSAIIFSDNFNNEVGLNVTNYNSFMNWNVSGGTVDLISNGGFGISCFEESGKCVDLDGSTRNAAILTSKQTFDLSPGTYELSFALSGNPLGNNLNPDRNSLNSVTVSLGDVFSETFTKSGSDPFETILRSILVSDPLSTNIAFNHAGGDHLGIILDNVTLSKTITEVGEVPVPAASWLFLSAIIGLFGFKKHKY